MPDTSKGFGGGVGRGALLFTGLLLVFLTRLPQLTGPNLFPDGDECVVGLMAKHLLEGSDFSLFFWGQRYGLAVFETGAAAVFFKLFGFSTVSLKAAVLCLWAVGWAFFVLFLGRLGNGRLAAAGGLLLLFAPAWGITSLKARVTMVTAFMVTAFSLWLVSGLFLAKPPRAKSFFLLGCCLATLALVNPLWLTVVLPFVALLVYEQRRITPLPVMVFGAAILTAMVAFVQPADRNPDYYWATPLFTDGDLICAVKLLPERLWVTMSGAYFMGTRLAPGPGTVVSATVWTLFTLGFAVYAVVSRQKKSPADFLVRGSIMAIIALLFFSLFFNHQCFGFRYFLPLAGSLVVLMAVGLDRMWRRGKAAGVIGAVVFCLLIVTGMAALMESRHVASSGLPPPHAKQGEAGAMADLVERLLRQDIRFVFSLDGLLQWQIMFASEETIKARWRVPFDRYPKYALAVDQALATRERIAVVDRSYPKRSSMPRVWSGYRHEDLDGWYRIIIDPERAMLEEMGFVFFQT